MTRRSAFTSVVGQVVLGAHADNVERLVGPMDPSSPYPKLMMAPADAMKIFKARYDRARRCSSLVFGRSSCIAEGAAQWQA